MYYFVYWLLPCWCHYFCFLTFITRFRPAKNSNKVLFMITDQSTSSKISFPIFWICSCSVTKGGKKCVCAKLPNDQTKTKQIISAVRWRTYGLDKNSCYCEFCRVRVYLCVCAYYNGPNFSFFFVGSSLYVVSLIRPLFHFPLFCL